MRKRISPSMIIACLALFFSLGGAGAWAAGRYLITSVQQIKPSVRHALMRRGPPGRAGEVDWSRVYVVRALAPVHELSPSTPIAQASAACRAGDHALSGGFIGTHEIVTTSLGEIVGTPASTAGWYVLAHLEPGASYGTVQAWAACVSP